MRPVAAGKPESVPLWQRVVLPHCFNAEDAVDPDVNYYQGAGWYRTTIDPTGPYRNGRLWLEFEGAGQRSDLYVYLTRVGSHTGGYDGWRVDITEAVAAFCRDSAALARFGGRVPIAVRCDNSRDLQLIPSDMSDFNLYGGLYRYVNLVHTPALCFETVQLDASLDEAGGSGSLTVRARLNGRIPAGRPARYTMRITDPDGREIARTTGTVDAATAAAAAAAADALALEQAAAAAGRCDAPAPFGSGSTDAAAASAGSSTPAATASAGTAAAAADPDAAALVAAFTVDRPRCWSPDSPQRYTCSIELLCDGDTLRTSERFGFRRFRFEEHGPFYLNGERLLLRGTHRHEDHAGVGAAMTEEMIRRDMEQIKAMGANFIRLGHYQQSEIVLDLCDELGLLVWEEIPWCRGGLGGERYRAQARRMLTNMIEQHRNHPSIILWGLGNENDWPGDFPDFDAAAIRAFMAELNALAHRLDPSRLTCIRRCDFCKDLVDVYSPSIWAGWYSRRYRDYGEMERAGIRSVPRFLHAEWGGDSHPGRHAEGPFDGVEAADRNGDWSESYIVRLFDWHLREQETMPELTGALFWTFKDFSTPLRPRNPIPYVNQKGVVQRDGTPKESYYVFQSYWSTTPMIHICGHSWPVRHGAAGELKEVLVYSNCPEVELFVNGRSCGRRQRDPQDFPAAGLHWQVQLREGENRIEAVSADGTLRDEIRQEYRTARWGAPVQLRLRAAEEDEATLLLEAEVVDEAGNRCLDAACFLRFTSTDPASLMSNRGTAEGSSCIQAANGRAAIRLRKGRAQTVCVRADDDSLRPAFYSF